MNNPSFSVCRTCFSFHHRTMHGQVSILTSILLDSDLVMKHLELLKSLNVFLCVLCRDVWLVASFKVFLRIHISNNVSMDHWKSDGDLCLTRCVSKCVSDLSLIQNILLLSTRVSKCAALNLTFRNNPF